MRDTAGARNPKTSACLQFLPHIYIDTYLFLHIYNTSHIEEKKKKQVRGTSPGGAKASLIHLPCSALLSCAYCLATFISLQQLVE